MIAELMNLVMSCGRIADVGYLAAGLSESSLKATRQRKASDASESEGSPN
jgi:hypothetical protein